jgi:D-tyrosyl-tRNA(Tyr) deacylase
MRAVVQRVTRASVVVEGETVGQIGPGLCVFVGVMNGDSVADAAQLAKKVVQLRIFSDQRDRMNLCVKEISGQVLAVSQFTLAGDVRKGNRPSFGAALAPEQARELVDEFCRQVERYDVVVETGRFQSQMSVSIENDGPVTILLDTAKSF